MLAVSGKHVFQGGTCLAMETGSGSRASVWTTSGAHTVLVALTEQRSGFDRRGGRGAEQAVFLAEGWCPLFSLASQNLFLYFSRY